jgi:hypothetical protein
VIDDHLRIRQDAQRQATRVPIVRRVLAGIADTLRLAYDLWRQL